MSEKEGRGELSCKEVSQQNHNLHIPRFLCNHWNHEFPNQSLQNKNKPNFLLELDSNLMLYCLLQTLSHQKLSLLLHNLYTRNRLQKMKISTKNLSCAKFYRQFSEEFLTLHMSFQKQCHSKPKVKQINNLNERLRNVNMSFSMELTLWFSPTFIFQITYRIPRNSKQNW